MPGGGSKPGERRGGRSAGTPNKITKALKDMILGALSDRGGQEYLARQAEENPAAFMSLLGKVLPTTLAQDPTHPLFSGMSTEELEERAVKRLIAEGIAAERAQAIIRDRRQQSRRIH